MNLNSIPQQTQSICPVTRRMIMSMFHRSIGGAPIPEIKRKKVDYRPLASYLNDSAPIIKRLGQYSLEYSNPNRVQMRKLALASFYTASNGFKANSLTILQRSDVKKITAFYLLISMFSELEKEEITLTDDCSEYAILVTKAKDMREVASIVTYSPIIASFL